MSVKATRDRIKTRVWQTLAQSDVNLSQISQEEMEDLVDLVTTAALLEVDAELDIAAGAEKERAQSTDVEEYDGERVLWEGRPLLSISTRYVITDERVRIIEGVVGKSRDDIELVRIQDIDQKQSVRERLLNVGDVIIRSHDRSHPTFILNNVKEPEEVHEILRRAVLEARQRHGLTYREEM